MEYSIRRGGLPTLALAVVAIIALPGWAKSPAKPDDTLTDLNTAATDAPEQVAVLRVMQKTHDPGGKPLRRVPRFRIFWIEREGDARPRPEMKSQHFRLKPGKYHLFYACGYGTSQLETATTQTFDAGRRYYIYCESRNVNHYELKVTEVP